MALLLGAVGDGQVSAWPRVGPTERGSGGDARHAAVPCSHDHWANCPRGLAVV